LSISTGTAKTLKQPRMDLNSCVGQLGAVVGVYTMGDSAVARKILETGQTNDAKSVQLGAAAVAREQRVTFRKGPYLVRIVAYQTAPDGPPALPALAHGVEAKL